MEEKDWSQILADFSATKEAKPNLSQAEWLQKFPEFGNDPTLLQAAFDYDETVRSGKYPNQDELRSKFPEFWPAPARVDVSDVEQAAQNDTPVAEQAEIPTVTMPEVEQPQQSQQSQQSQHFVGNVGMPESPEMENGRFAGTERQPEFVIPTEYTRENYAAVMRRAAELNAQLEKNGEESQILAQGGTMVYGDKLDELAEQSRAINRELAALGQFVEEWSKTEDAQVYFNELNDRVNQLQSVIDQNNKSNFWTRLAEVSMASEPGVMATEQGRQSVSMMQEVNEGGYDYKAAKNELRNARNQLRLERMRQNGEMTGLAFLRGLETANYYELIPFEGLTDATAILVAARDLKNGQELSESQKALLQAMQLRAEVDFNYQGNNTVWERVGQSAPEQLAFTLQFVLGAGLTGATATGERVAAKEAERAAIRYARKGVNSSARRFIGGTVLPKLEGMAVGATIQTFANPLSVEGIVEDFERRYAGDIYYDNKGNLHVFDNNRSAGQAAYQAIASAWIENFTEYAGENITKSFKLADSKMFDLAGKFDNVMKRTGASRIADVFAIPKELGHLTQIGSAPEEFLEEELGSVMNALFATDAQRGESYGDAFKRTIGQSFSGEQQLETLLSVTITSMLLGGGGNAVNAVGNADYRRQVNRSVEKSRALLDHVNIDVDELDSQIDNGQISDIAQWLKEQSDANGWSQDEQGAAVSYVLNRARQIGMKHNDDTAIAEAQEQMRQQAQDMANRWDGQIYNATWKDGNGQEQPVTIVNGRVHYTTRENGTVHFDPYTSSGMVAIRLSDGTKKQVPARDITGIQSVMSVDEQLQSQEQTIPQMMRSQFEQEGLAIPTVESVWGGSFVAGQTQLGNGMYTYIGQDSEGRYAFQNNDPKSSKEMPILYMTERQLVEYGLSLNIQSAEDQRRQEAQEALDFMQLLDGIRQEASESQQWDLVKAYAERAVEFDEAGQVSPDTDPRVYAPYLLACAEGSYENAISGIDQSVAALISAQSQQAQGTDISTDAGFNAETHANMEHLDERTARLVEFYTKTREALIEMQQGQQEAMEESIAETPVSQMGIDQAFSVTWNGQQAEAVVTGIDADQRRVVTVRDMEGNDIESGIDDMSDEQWEAVRVKPEAEQQAPQEETPVQQEEQEQQTQEIEQNQPEIEQNTEEIEQQEPETAQPEAPKSPAEQTYEGLELKFGEKAGHKVDVTVDDRAKTLEKAKKALDKAQKEYDDAPIGKEEKFEKALEKAQQEYEEALADKQAWDEVKSVRDRRAAERIAAQQAEDEQRRQQAVAEEEARKAEEAQKAAEREATGANNVAPSIRGKWDGAPRIEGNQDEITLANGERITGRYMLVESGAASASHDALNGFRKTEGFPIDENDQSVNDRDYERDQHAQQITRQMANEYDSRALQDPVVVSRDGVVLSGNGRTMAGEIAASQGTDGAYIDYLKRFPQKYGFTPEQVGSMAHPRLVFVPDADMPYTSETFAKFNQQEMKGQSKTEQAVKLGKLVDDDTFKRIIRSINRFDTLGDFYADPKAAADAIDELQNAGVINQMQRSEMFDGETISAQGREIIENMLIGKAFESNPDAVRQLTEVKGLRQSIITALAEISNNIALGEYSLESELSKAIGLAYQARKSGFRAGDRVSEFARTGVLFEGESLTVASDGATETDYTNATVLMLADLINDTRSTQLKKTLAIYNRKAEQSAAGQIDIFSGGVETKQDILKEVLLLLQHGTETEQQRALDEAREQRKDAAEGADGVQQDGSTGTGDEGERGVTPESPEEEPQQETAEQAAVENTEPQSGYTVSPAQYTTKRGKVLNMQLVKFDKELTKEQQRAANALARDLKGWWSKDDGGFMMRDTDTAQQLIEAVLQESGEKLKDSAPLSLQELRGEEEQVESTDEAVAAANEEVDTNPTEAQKEAGNYKKGHVTIDGFDISIENPAGSTRSGVDANGQPWSVTMRNSYGYIRMTEGVDGDHIDIFLSDHLDDWTGDVFVVDQVKEDGSFDEHKVMYGFDTEEEAREAYLANYSPGWKGLGAITLVSRKGFKKWVESSHRKTKPFAEYKQIVFGNQQQATANGYGAKNKLVSQDRYEELKRKMKDKLNGQMNMGIDPEILAIGTEMAVYHIEAGARKFADFCKNMVADLGDAIRPYLKAFYNGARDLPEMEEAGYLEELTPYDEVKSFDVTGFDKGGSTFEETAQEAVKEAEVEQQVEEAEDKLKQQRNDGRKLQDGELSLRPATEADFESEHPTVYFQGKPYGVIMVMRSGEQIGAAQFSKPHIDRVYLTNGQDVTIDQLQVIDRDAEGKAKEKSRNGKKTSKEKKKDVSSQPDLFSSDTETPEIKPQDHDRRDEQDTGEGTPGETGADAAASDEVRGEREETPSGAGTEREADRAGVEGRSDQHVPSGVPAGESVGTKPDAERRLDSGLQERRDDGRRDSGVQGGDETVRSSTGRSSGPVQELKNSHNNHAERGTDYAPKGVDARIEANIKAIELAQQLIESGQQATPEQMAVLRQFSGWGGLGKAFTESSYGWSADGAPARLKALLGDEAYEQANMSRNSAYYTPASVIDTLWDIARAMGFEGGTVLEGSAGIGNIIGLMPKDMSQRSDIHAVEIDQTTGGILSLLYPDAKVEIQGFEATEVENGSIDLAITNVPFVTGLRVNDTTGDRDLSRRFHDIHDFCIAKNIRKLREGGIGIFITSSGTLDNSARLREWIVNEGGADVVGAFRLNNETFGGTGVTSDIIIVRKRVNGKKSPHAIDVSVTSGERVATYDTGETRKVKGKEVPIVQQLSMDYNRYFIEHPEMMAGDMRFGFEEGETYRPKSKALYPSKGKDQRQMLADFVKSFEGKDWEKSEATTEQQPNVYEELGDDVKEGSMLVNKDGVLCVAQRGKAVPLEVNANKVKGHTKVECFRSYQAVKQALTDVLAYQTENDSDDGLQPLLDKLNKAFDGFVKTYGHLHKNVAINFLKNDVDWPSILALETFTETGDKKGDRVQTYGKTDIFSKRVVEKEKEPEPKTVKDGIIASIYLYGRVDVPYISQHLGMSEDEVKQEIIKQGLGFENPTTRQMDVKYEYLSGNVREKLRQAIENNTDGRYDANIKALEAVVPMSIPAHLIDFSIGSSWVDPKLYAEYVKDRTGIDVSFFAAGGTWVMRTPRWVGEEQNRAFGVRSELLGETIMGTQLIEAAMQNKSITVSKQRKHYDGTTETIIDKEATQACAAKIDEIRQDFKDWAKAKMQSDPEMAEQMERVYNDMFNNYVPMEIDDDFVPEYFSGASHTIKLEKHQAKAALRAVLQPLMLAHEVGAGKTFTLITTAMEMRRLGTAKKPMIVVQNATVGQFVESAKRLYPNAKILTIEEADRTVEGRKNFYAKIKYNDWDMIVVPQSVFERIPDSEERQMAYVQEKIQEKMMVIEKMREADFDGASSIVRQSEREIEKLEEQLSQLTEAISDKRKQRDRKKEAVVRQNAEVKALEMLDRQTDDVENFDDMGIDAILVDEAHEYKHLGFATAMQRGVKGVDPSYSKKAQGVFLKAQAVKEKNNGRNVVFATGTPISNTAAEVWTFMRYLMPEETMEQYGIYYFDDFVRNFGLLQQMLEFTTSGNFKENNRFAGYINLPELVRIWLSVADVVTQKEIEDERESMGKESKLPEIENGKAQDIYLPQSKALRSIMKYVKETLMDYEKMTGKQKKENSHIPLVMYGIAKAAAVDVRLVMNGGEVAGHESSQGELVEDDYLDDPHSKTNEAVRQTLRTLEETKDYRGTVAIFADVYQNKVTGFNIYEDIRRKLIAAGVPESEIVIMKSGMSVKKKLEIFEKMNRGEIRVMLGSTFTLGTGVNIQERLHTLIHLDAPNRPMDYDQRNGRIWRQGNMHKQWGIPVRILRFGVEDSLDVTAYQRLKTKGAIAQSIMHGKDMLKNSMENRMLEEEEDVFGDTVAQLSGSEFAMKKNQAERELRKLQAKQKQWEADQTYVHNQIPRLKGLIKEATGRMEQARKNLERLSKMPEHPTITIGRYTFNSLEEMADFIKEYNAGLKQDEAKMRGNAANGEKSHRKLTVNVGGIDFVFEVTMTLETQRKGGVLTPVVKRDMTYSCEALELKDVPVFQMLFRNGLDDIINHVVTGSDSQGVIESAQASIERYNRELEQLKERDGRPFENEAELRQAKERLEEYTEAMKKEMEEKEAKYADMDAEVSTATGLSQADEAEEEDEDETGTGESPISYNSFEEINDRFNKGLSELTEENADSVVLRLGMPSPVLLSSGIPNKELHLYGNKLMKKARDHGFAPTDIKDLPKALQNPIAVFVGSHNGSFAVLTEMMLNGKNTLVSIESNKRGEVEFNIISSVYGKDNSGVINWINNGKLLYADKKKTLAFVSASALFADATQIQEFISAANIVDNFENPTLEEENFSAEEQQLSLSLQFNSEEYETQDGETIGYTSLLGAASGVQTEEDKEGDRSADSVQRGEDISSFALRRLDEGETCHVERRYRKTKQFDFTGSEKIESADDVAFIFKQLQDAAVENTFIVLVKDGRPTVIHTGMGGYAQSTVAIGTVLSAYRNINPDQVWMIHNHPSGNVVASHQDITLFNKLRSIFGDKLQDGIIIDTTSGKYGTFNENMRGEGKMQEKNDDAVPVDVYEFSKQVFEKDWNPETAFTIRNSSDVAQFVSSHRLGEHPKMSLIVLDQGGHIVGNIFLPYTSLGKKNLESVIDDVSYYVNQMGGTEAILFGNFTSQGKSTVKSLAKGLNTRDINLLDVLFTDEREAWNHGLASFAQKGWLSEERQKYGSEVHDDTFAGPEHRIADEYNRRTGANVEGVSGRVKLKEKLYRDWFDGLHPLEQLQQVVEKALGRKLRDSEKAYELATMNTSIGKVQMDRAETEFMLPVLRTVAHIVKGIVAEEGVSKEEAFNRLSDYMLAKHGLERNEWFHQQNPDAEEEDKAGLRGLAESLGENPDDYKAVAERVVSEFESSMGTEAKELWDAVKALTVRMLEISYESGMINKDTFEELRNRHRYYIPLRGFADGTSGDLFDYVSSAPHFQSVLKKMNGRKSKADDPLANLYNMLQSSIVIGNHNKVMQRIYNLAVNSKSDLLRVSRSWYVYNDATDEWEERFPDIPEDATADEIDAIMKRFDADMQQLKANGQARQYINRMKLRKKVLPYQYKEHEMVAYVNGRKVVMYVAGNPLVAQAMNRLNESQLGRAFEIVQDVTRWYSAINTSWSPSFGFTNAQRDIRFALFSSLVTGGVKKNMRMVGNLFRAGWSLPRLIVTGKMDAGLVKMFSKEEAARIGQWWNEFLDNGGETGFTRTLSAEKARAELKDTIRHIMNGSEDGQSRLKKYTVGILETMGRYSEDICRFAAYCLQRASGDSVLGSVNEAKNVTVNFNVKGGGQLAAQCRACYSFFNASMQGINRMMRLAKENPKSFTAVVSAVLLGGAIVPWLNMSLFVMLGGDDDDWNKYEMLSEYTANNNLILFVGDHKFIKIRCSQELAPFSAIGNIWFRQQMGWNKGRSVAEQVADMFVDMSPVSVTRGEHPAAGVVKTIMPTVTEPVWEALFNEDFTGSPIYKDTPWNKFDAGWEKAYENRTSKWLIDASKWIYGTTGGKVDVNPAIVEHIVSNVLGGLGRSGSSMMKYFSDGFLVQNAPFIRTVMFDSDEQGYAGAVSREYGRLAYDVLPEMKHRIGDMDLAQYAEAVNTTEYRIANIVSGYKTGKDLAGNEVASARHGENRLKPYKKPRNGRYYPEIVGIDGMTSYYKDMEANGIDEDTLEEYKRLIVDEKMRMLHEIQQVIYEGSGEGRKARIDRVREIEQESKRRFSERNGE